MWKCSSCQNENKDEYRFCLNCGNPRPTAPAAADPDPDDEEDEPKKSTLSTILLILLALILVVAIVLVIILFPRLQGLVNPQSDDTGEPASRTRRYEPEATEKPEKGGTSSFIFGNETPAPSTAPTGEPAASADPAPSESLIPIPTPTVAPSTAPEATPAPTEAAPTPAPAGDYLIPDSNSRYLTEDDLKDLSWEQCCLARNEIFARHGRMFVTSQIASYFEGKSWYKGTIPAASFSESVLNEFERANVNFIHKYESEHWGGSYY